MSAKFKYISESDRKAISLAKTALKRIKKRFVKLCKKENETLLDQSDDWKPHALALWRMCDELDWVGISVVNDDTNELSITV